MSASVSEPRWLRLAAHPGWFALASGWLLALTVVGTISQKYIGLWASQQLYFSAWWVWAFDSIPLPGGALTLGLCFLNLTAFAFTRRALARPMLAVTHAGVAVLLGGGFITGNFKSEGNLVLQEGGISQTIVDPRFSELAVIDTSDPESDMVIAFRPQAIYAGAELTHDKLAPRFTVVAAYPNSRLQQLQGAAPEGARGMAARFQLEELPVHPKDAENTPGIVFRVHNSHADGLYLLQSEQQIPQSLTAGGFAYRLEYRPARQILPFAVELKDFQETTHAGMRMAAAYHSQVVVHLPDGEQRQALIEMNQPLRLMGWTLYQASFSRGSDASEVSVLACVKDAGAWFPYIGTILLAIGLLGHLIVLAWQRRSH